MVEGCKSKEGIISTVFKTNNYAIKINANLRSRGSQTLNLLGQLSNAPNQVVLALTVLVISPQLQGAKPKQVNYQEIQAIPN